MASILRKKNLYND